MRPPPARLQVRVRFPRSLRRFHLLTMAAFPTLAAGLLLLLHAIPTVVSNPVFHPHHFSNGVIQLIIEAYSEELIREMESRWDSAPLQLHGFLRQRLRALYDHIRHHPALHQRHLWVGKGRPTEDPSPKQSHSSSKRKRYLGDEEKTPEKKAKTSFPAEEICKTNRLWEQINSTHDFYDNEVEVIQDNVQQYVFSYRCVAEAGPCIGISPLYDSECTERYGWMYMYYRRKDDPYRTPQWGFVAAPHHCACKITPKYIPDT